MGLPFTFSNVRPLFYTHINFSFCFQQKLESTPDIAQRLWVELTRLYDSLRVIVRKAVEKGSDHFLSENNGQDLDPESSSNDEVEAFLREQLHKPEVDL